jgi:ABC-type transporter Mla MlaB component
MMKDGMNSASRYYVNRFKDNLKQVAIDLMLGQVQPDEALAVLAGVQKDINEDSEEVILQTADRVRQVANLFNLKTLSI